MKLRFVKFFTSRENEIEKKEEGGRSTALACSTVTQLARNHSPAPAPRSSLHHSHSLSLHPAPPTYLLRRPSLSAATGRESNALQLSPPPAVLLNDNRARPARRTLAPSSNRMAAASLRFQWHPLCGDWSHRKTKYENELSCFITFIDE